ncbi:MAG: CoA transferase [SAR202 cluster bacterium]|nr:CoA transferase [SAR202 cluster bacterium]
MANKKTNENQGPLSGVRVLDLTRILAGPFGTRILADMGAEVIKIEPPGGDAARQFEYTTPEGVSGYFMQQNLGKKDICLDFAHPKALEAVRRLVKMSDVVVENFRPGVMDRLGIGYKDLKKLKPSIILCSVSAFGQKSPYSRRPAGDMVIQAMSGLASLTGDPDGPPQTTGMSISDTTGGLHAFGAICAALYQRSVTGEGQHIDIALIDCILWQNEWASQYIFLSQGQLNPTRYGNRRPILIPGNLFKGKDGWIAIVASTDPGWRNLTRAMGRPELGEDARYSNRTVRMANRDELERLVEEWVASFDSVKQVEALLGDRGGVQCGRVRTWKEIIEDPHTRERELVAEVEDPVLGKTRVVNSPFRLAQGKAGARGGAPLMGQHTLEVLQGMLGMSNQEVLELLNANALHADERVMPEIVQKLMSEG